MPHSHRAHHHLTLACDGLPVGIGSIAPGRCYALVTDSEDDSAALTLPILAHAVKIGHRACWLADAQPERAMARTGMDFLGHANQNRHLEVLCWNDEPSSDTQDLLRELNHFHIKEKGFFLIEGAERLLAGTEAPAAALDALRQWARKRNHSVLLVFRHPADQRDPSQLLRQAADHLAGHARWAEGHEGVTLEVLHWFGAAGCSAAGSYRLEKNETGHLRVSANAQDSVLPTLPPASDEHSVFVMRNAIPAGHPVPGGWHVCDDMVQLVEATTATVAATLILGYDRDTKLRDLQETVLRVRRERGPRLKIVIRENNIRLRHNQESAMLRLGTNMVIPAEVPASRWTSLVHMIQGQLYWRDLPRSLDAALADAAAEHAQGYVAPVAFCKTVTTMLRHSRSMGISNALVVLPMARGLAPADALRHCVIRRPGDICSADEENFYLFLYACHEIDVTPTLERLFNLPLGDLFDEEVRCITPSTIQDAADAFALRAPKLPDLSIHAAHHSAAPTAQATPGQTSPIPGAASHRAHRPVLRPLHLRTA
ncbi:MAG TPA: cellulose biosynthesis protein BcsE [Rhodocyclaceae bacterium]|nr:cellulose biosynthesis protein BcsE [Rhodocyclaceae bacterium]